MSLLTLENVSGGYGQVQVLHDIDLSVEEGHVAVVLGANGAGKTTTLRAISGVRAHGSIVFDGMSLLVGKSPEAVSRMGIAHVPQGRGTFSELTVDENMRIGAVNRKDREIRGRPRPLVLGLPRLGERRRRRPAA